MKKIDLPVRRYVSLLCIKICVCCMMFLLPPALHAAEYTGMEMEQKIATYPSSSGDFQFSLFTGVGYVTGEMNEYVYEPDSGHKNSQLIWDIDNLVMGKIGASVQYKNAVTIKIDSWWKLSDGSGNMEDYDWVIDGVTDWSDWSKSNTDITAASIIDISANYAFFHYKNYTLQGIFGFKRDHFNILATGGKYIYSENGFRDETGSFPDVPGIGYKQTWQSIYAGLGVVAFFPEKFLLSGRAIFSPFVDGKAIDHHYMRNIVTEDKIRNGRVFAVEVSAGWAFRPDFIWNVAVDYQKYSTSKGDSRWEENGHPDYLENAAGMEQESLKFSTGITYTF